MLKPQMLLLLVLVIGATVILLRLLQKRAPAPTAPAGPSAFMHLQPGRRYRVARAFTDFDGIVHPVGETWTFNGYNFLPYDDGLTLIIDPGGLRLQWRPEAQGEIINDLEHFIVAAD